MGVGTRRGTDRGCAGAAVHGIIRGGDRGCAPERLQERIGEEIVEILVPQLMEEIVEFMKINPQDQRQQIRFLTVGSGSCGQG